MVFSELFLSRCNAAVVGKLPVDRESQSFEETNVHGDCLTEPSTTAVTHLQKQTDELAAMVAD